MSINCRELRELVDRFEGLVGHQVFRLRTEDPPYFHIIPYSQPRMKRLSQYDQWNSNALSVLEQQPLRVARKKAILLEKQLYKFVNPNLVTSLNRRTFKASCEAERIGKLISKLKKHAKKSNDCPEKKMNCCEMIIKLKAMLVRQKCEWQCVGRLKETMTIAGEMKNILKFISQLVNLLDHSINHGFRGTVPERPPSYEITCGLTDDSFANSPSQFVGDNTYDLSELFDSTDIISSISPHLMNASTRQSHSEITISLSFDLDDDDDDDNDDDDNDNDDEYKKCHRSRFSSRDASKRTESLDRSLRNKDQHRKHAKSKHSKRNHSVSGGSSPSIQFVKLPCSKTHKSPKYSSDKCKQEKHLRPCSLSPKKHKGKCERQSSSKPQSIKGEKKCTSSPRRKIIISAECDNGEHIKSNCRENEPGWHAKRDYKTFSNTLDKSSSECVQSENNLDCVNTSPPKSKPEKRYKCTHHSTSKRKSCGCSRSKSASAKKFSINCRDQKRVLSDIEEGGSQTEQNEVEDDKAKICDDIESESYSESDSEFSSPGRSFSSSVISCESPKTERCPDGKRILIKAECEKCPKKKKYKESKSESSCQDMNYSSTSSDTGESKEPLIVSSKEIKMNFDEINCSDMSLSDCKMVLCGFECNAGPSRNNNLLFSPRQRSPYYEKDGGKMKMTICLQEEISNTKASYSSSTVSAQSNESKKGDKPKERSPAKKQLETTIESPDKPQDDKCCSRVSEISDKPQDDKCCSRVSEISDKPQDDKCCSPISEISDKPQDDRCCSRVSEISGPPPGDNCFSCRTQRSARDSIQDSTFCSPSSQISNIPQDVRCCVCQSQRTRPTQGGSCSQCGSQCGSQRQDLSQDTRCCSPEFPMSGSPQGDNCSLCGSQRTSLLPENNCSLCGAQNPGPTQGGSCSLCGSQCGSQRPEMSQDSRCCMYESGSQRTWRSHGVKCCCSVGRRPDLSQDTRCSSPEFPMSRGNCSLCGSTRPSKEILREDNLSCYEALCAEVLKSCLNKTEEISPEEKPSLAYSERDSVKPPPRESPAVPSLPALVEKQESKHSVATSVDSFELAKPSVQIEKEESVPVVATPVESRELARQSKQVEIVETPIERTELARQSKQIERTDVFEEDAFSWYETAEGRKEFFKKWWKFILLLLMNLYFLYIAFCVITSPVCTTCSVVPRVFMHFISSAKRSVRLIHYSPVPI